MPFPSNKPASNFETWFKGEDKIPNMLKITEDYVPSFSSGEVKIESKDPNVVALA